MALPEFLQNNLRVPVVGSPLFLVSGPELVIAQCKAGIIGSFPALNARPQKFSTNGSRASTPSWKNIKRPIRMPSLRLMLLTKSATSNDRLMVDMETCVKHKVPIIITSLRPPAEIVEAAHSYGGVVYHDVINVKHARKAAEEGVDGLILVCAGPAVMPAHSARLRCCAKSKNGSTAQFCCQAPSVTVSASRLPSPWVPTLPIWAHASSPPKKPMPTRAIKTCSSNRPPTTLSTHHSSPV